MTLKELLRQDFASYVRPHFEKSECEVCGNKIEYTHVHHVTHFQDLLNETLEQLNLDYYEDVSMYTEEQLRLIQDIMIGKQMKIKYITCCEPCHMELHTKVKNPLKKCRNMCNSMDKKIREKGEIELQKYIEEIDKNLQGLIGIIDTKEKKERLFEVTYEDGGRTVRKINSWFGYVHIKLPYKLYTKIIDGKTVWILERKEELKPKQPMRRKNR